MDNDFVLVPRDPDDTTMACVKAAINEALGSGTVRAHKAAVIYKAAVHYGSKQLTDKPAMGNMESALSGTQPGAEVTPLDRLYAVIRAYRSNDAGADDVARAANAAIGAIKIKHQQAIAWVAVWEALWHTQAKALSGADNGETCAVKAIRELHSRAQSAVALESRLSEVEAALKELVRLRDLKDSIEARRGKTANGYPSPSRDYWLEGLEDEYDRCKPLAWAEARRVLGDT